MPDLLRKELPHFSLSLSSTAVAISCASTIVSEVSRSSDRGGRAILIATTMIATLIAHDASGSSTVHFSPRRIDPPIPASELMVHSGYVYGCDNPYGLDISSPTFGIGGCAKLHFTDHFRAGFEGYFSTAPLYDWEPENKAVFNKQPFFALDPYVGVEYAVGKALRLTLKADWLLAINSRGLNMPMGPRIYFGFIFAH